MPVHNCDWDQQKALVLKTMESNNEDIKCIHKKLSDLKAQTALLPDMRKDIEEIKNFHTKNNSSLSKLNVDLGKLQVSSNRPYYVAGLISAIISGLALLVKLFH